MSMSRFSASVTRLPPEWSDVSVAALLVVQLFITFVVIPLSVQHPAWHALMPLGGLLFAAVCAVLLTRRTAVRLALLLGVIALAVVPLAHPRNPWTGYADPAWRELIDIVAFGFNLLVTSLVALHAFGSGRVTVHRIQGAILVYLNVAVLFSIVFSFLEVHSPGAIQRTGALTAASAAPMQVADMTYFSLATITTTGYGDMMPVHPLARSLANLEALFGQLFPATILARVVALHLAHSGAARPRPDGQGSSEEAAGEDVDTR
jgi:voltage-gated potassium channel Kch